MLEVSSLSLKLKRALPDGKQRVLGSATILNPLKSNKKFLKCGPRWKHGCQDILKVSAFPIQQVTAPACMGIRAGVLSLGNAALL